MDGIGSFGHTHEILDVKQIRKSRIQGVYRLLSPQNIPKAESIRPTGVLPVVKEVSLLHVIVSESQISELRSNNLTKMCQAASTTMWYRTPTIANPTRSVPQAIRAHCDPARDFRAQRC